MSSRNILKHTVNTITPTDPSLGDEWSNVSNGRIYKYLAVNGNSPQWVELYSASSAGGLTLPSWSNSTRPVGIPSLGYNNTTNRVEFYNNKTRISRLSGSLQFDGSTTYLTAPPDSRFVFGTGDFTIECWYYWNGTPPVVANLNQYTLVANLASLDNTTWDLQYYNGNWRFAAWTATHLSGGGSIGNGNTWYHIAVTRASGVGQIWVNGVSTTGPVAFTTNLSSQGQLKIGNTGAGQLWNGNISNLRIINGTALYNSTFTPPTSPLSNALPNTKLLLWAASNADKLLDSSSGNNPVVLTNVNGVAYSALTPFSTGTGVVGYGEVIAASNWINIQRRPTAFEYLIVGGGGGAGSGFSTHGRGGGGGAGGLVYGNIQNYVTTSNSTIFTITVGGGGAGAATGASVPGTTGTISSLGGLITTSTALATLLRDRSTNSFTVTNVGGVIIGTTSTYGSVSAGIAFDGATQRIALPMNSINPGSLDFTIEGWVYPVSSTAGAFFVGQADLVSAGGSSIVCYINSAGTCDLYIGGGSAAVTSPTCPVNQWSHVAYVRNGATGGTWRSYLNGNIVGSVAVTGAVNAGSATYPPNIGGFPTGINMFSGIISNFRMTVGVAVYTGSFTVPSMPLTLTQSASGTSTSAIVAGQTAVLLGINTDYVVKTAGGGGAGASWNAWIGGDGASGGGGATWSPTSSLFAGSSTQASIYGYGLGNIGSTASNYTNNTLSAGGGGGGAGGVGTAGTLAGQGGYGGPGSNLYSSFLAPTGIGVFSTSGSAATVVDTVSYGPAMGSLNFNSGANQYVQYGAASDWTFASNGSQDYTLECWFYTTSTAYQTLCGTAGNAGSIGFEFSINGNGAGSIWVAYERGAGVGTNSIPTTAAGLFSANAWNHVAYTFVSSTKTASFYVNGVSRTVSLVAGTQALNIFPFSASTPTNPLAVGYAYTGSAFTNGYITNFRIVKGRAVYTSNFDYTKILPFVNSTNTQLLLLVPNDANKLLDSSNIANTSTNVAGVTFSNLVPSTSVARTQYSGAGLYYIAGGGGGGAGVSLGLGGAGGGANGALSTNDGSTGTQYTGGGGGGGGGIAGGNGAGGSGGSGVVIIRYPEAYSTGTVTQGSARVVVSGAYRNYIFTSSGVLSI